MLHLGAEAAASKTCSTFANCRHALTFDNRCCAAAATRNSAASRSSNESESNLDDFLALRIVFSTAVVHPPEPPVVHVAIAAHGIAAREHS